MGQRLRLLCILRLATAEFVSRPRVHEIHVPARAGFPDEPACEKMGVNKIENGVAVEVPFQLSRGAGCQKDEMLSLYKYVE